jgi:hypothetical protein
MLLETARHIDIYPSYLDTRELAEAARVLSGLASAFTGRYRKVCVVSGELFGDSIGDTFDFSARRMS